MHAELCYAECLLQKALLTFVQVISCTSYIVCVYIANLLEYIVYRIYTVYILYWNIGL